MSSELKHYDERAYFVWAWGQFLPNSDRTHKSYIIIYVTEMMRPEKYSFSLFSAQYEVLTNIEV